MTADLIDVGNIPEELRALPRWVGWRAVQREGKWTKIPISPVTRRGADCNDPADWGPFEAALALIESENCNGVSFALGADVGYVGIDLDDVIDPDTGEVDADAFALVERFASYAELSPSRTGVHIWVRGTLAHLVGRKRGDRECYDQKRFLTVTGFRGSPHGIEARQDVLDRWHAEVWPPADRAGAYTGPTRPLDLSDTEILGRIGRSSRAPKFARLWAGNTDDYKSGSEADLALCGMLSFWCRRDPAAVDRLFRSSGLMRSKWDAPRGGSTYGARTVAMATASSGSYDPEYRSAPPPGPSTPGPGAPGPSAPSGETPPPAPGPPANPGAPPPLPISYFADVTPALDVADFVEGLLIDGAMTVVYGESNCGKTFFVLDLALHVAGGEPWRRCAVERRGVLYLALEGAYGIRNRIAAFKADRANAADLAFAFVPVALSLFGPASDTLRVIDAAKEAAERLAVPVGLVVVDTLSRAMAGGNENASEDMSEFVRNVDLIRQALPAHVAVVHHSGKDTARGARGHSSLRAATDTEIEVSRDPVSRVSVARVTKQRDLEGGGEFAFRLAPVQLGLDRRDKLVASCVVREVTAPVAAPGPDERESRPSPAETQAVEDRAVLLAVESEEAEGEAGATITRIRERTRYGAPRATRIVARLVNAGVIEPVRWKKGVGNGATQDAEGWRKLAG